MVTVTDIAARTGLDPAQVARSLEALDPVYVDFRKTVTGGDPRFWYVFKVTPEARRAVGQWPTADSLISALTEQLYAASHQDTGDERQSLLAYAARLIGDTLRDLVVEAAGRVLSPALGDVALPEPAPLPAPAPAKPGAAVAAVAAAAGSAVAGSAVPAADGPGVAKPKAAADGEAEPEVAEPEAAQPGAVMPAAEGPEAEVPEGAEAEAAKPELTWSPPAWPDPPGAVRTEPGRASPDLVPLPEPAPFPASAAGRGTISYRTAVGWPRTTTAVTDPDAADTDRRPLRAPGDATNAG